MKDFAVAWCAAAAQFVDLRPYENTSLAEVPEDELVATFAGMFDLRVGDRRFVYRWR